MTRVRFLAALALAGASPWAASAQTLTLGTAADSALARHPTVLAAEARMDGAAAMRDAARAAFLPSVVGASALTRHAEPMVVAPLHGFDPMHPPDFDRTLLQSQLLMEVTLFDGGGRRAQVRGAEAAEEATGSGREVTVQDVLQNVTVAYTGVLAARKLREAASRHVGALSAEMDRAEQRLAEGTAARVEVLRAQAALSDAQAQWASAQSRVGLAERNLARVMDVAPESVEGSSLADIRPASRPATSSTTEDPRLEAARRNVDLARARLAQERAGRLPSLRASAGLLNFGSGLGDFVTEWQAGVRVSWPLFTGGARTAAIHRADADVRVAEEELRQAELAVATALDAAQSALVEASARSEALSASVAQWEEVARIEALSLESGAGVQQDFLRAEAALFQAQAGYARAVYDQILALVARARAQGTLDRGWMDDALEMWR